MGDLTAIGTAASVSVEAQVCFYEDGKGQTQESALVSTKCRFENGREDIYLLSRVTDYK